MAGMINVGSEDFDQIVEILAINELWNRGPRSVGIRVMLSKNIPYATESSVFALL